MSGPPSGYTAGFRCQAFAAGARYATVGLWGEWNTSAYWYNQLSYMGGGVDFPADAIGWHGTSNGAWGVREATAGNMIIDDATILDFNWADGAYTMTEAEWDISLWIDDASNPLTGAPTDLILGNGDNTNEKIQTVTLDGYNISFGGELYGDSNPITLGDNGVIWMGNNLGGVPVSDFLGYNDGNGCQAAEGGNGCSWISMNSHPPCDLSNVTDISDRCTTLGTPGGIAWMWQDMQFTDTPATATPILDDLGAPNGVAFSFRRMLVGSRNENCEGTVTVQVQLRNDNSVRIVYVSTGYLLSMMGPQGGGEPSRINPITCGQAYIPFGSSPTDGTCVFGAAEGDTCEATCGNDTATSAGTVTAECTTLILPSPWNADGAPLGSAWLGLGDMECKCQVSAMGQTCNGETWGPDDGGYTRYVDHAYVPFGTGGSPDNPWGAAMVVEVGLGTCVPVTLTIADPSITSISIARVPLLFGRRGPGTVSYTNNKFLEVSCPVGYWQQGRTGGEDYYYYWYSEEDLGGTEGWYETPARCSQHGNWILPECYAASCESWDNWTLTGINSTDCDSKVVGESCTVSCDEGFGGEGGTFAFACSGVDIPKLAGAAIAVFSGDSVDCSANLCDESSLPSDAVTSNCSGLGTLEDCSVTCEPGYNNTGPNPASIFSCLASGDFNGTIDCIPNGIACDAANLPSGAGVDTSNCNDMTTAESCTVFCSPGYSGDGATFLCEGSATGAGDFSGSPVTCVADPCDASTLPSAPGIDMTGCSNIMFAETCSVSCQPGYFGDTASWTCDDSGSFIVNSTLCTASACDAFPSDEGVDASGCSGKVTDETCEISCVQGYTGDAVTKTCDSDGSFSGGSSSCIANACETGLPPHASIDTADCQGKTTAQTCTVGCSQGYTGDATIYVCGNLGAFSPSSGPSMGLDACSANECDATTLPTVPGINTANCLGTVTSQECTIECEPGYTAVGGSTATCSPSGGFDHSADCAPNSCDVLTLPFAVTRESCQTATTGMECTTVCRAGYTGESSASFSCLSSGSFEGILECVPIPPQLDLIGDEGNETIIKELTFSVSQNADQLVEELSNPSSAASQAVATSFSDALGLPQTSQVAVVSATLRLLAHERRLHHESEVVAVIEVRGVSAQDEAVLDAAMETSDTRIALGAHLEQNFQQVENIDIGYVQSVSVHPLPVANVANSTWDMRDEPEDDGCAHWDHLLAMVLSFQVLCALD